MAAAGRGRWLDIPVCLSSARPFQSGPPRPSRPSVRPRTLAARPSVGPQQRVLPMQLVFRLRRFHLRDERGAWMAPATEGRCDTVAAVVRSLLSAQNKTLQKDRGSELACGGVIGHGMR